MVRRKCADLYGREQPEWIETRLNTELNAITEFGYADLYYIAHKLVKYSKDHGYPVGSRGSVGSSLVAYLADITEVNPLAPHYRCPSPTCRTTILGDAGYGCGADMPDLVCPDCGTPMLKDGFNIPFEQFLGFEGNKIPDIDLNFSSEFRSTAEQYTEVLFGQDNVFKAGTVLSIAERTAYRYVKEYHEKKGQDIRGVEVNRLIRGLTGVRRTTGQHPGGIIVLPHGDEIYNYTPVQRPADAVDSRIVTTHFDYHALEKSLVKLDILGQECPTMIRLL